MDPVFPDINYFHRYPLNRIHHKHFTASMHIAVSADGRAFLQQLWDRGKSTFLLLAQFLPAITTLLRPVRSFTDSTQHQLLSFESLSAIPGT